MSQNWSVMNATAKFNYRLDNDPVITCTIRSDSFLVSGTDTIYSLNRTMCDTCVTRFGGPGFCDTCYGLKNLPMFAGRYCNVIATGAVHFYDTTSYVLYP